MATALRPTVFTQKFLDMDFSAYRYLLAEIQDNDDPLLCDFPAVPIPGFDIQVIQQIEHYCRNKASELFGPLNTQSMFKDWCYLPRSWGWEDITIKSSPMTLRARDKTVSWTSDPTADQIIIDFVHALFAGWWDKFFSIKIIRLRPGGWANPHRDIFSDDYKLTNFWMPLHQFSKGIKVFPLGWLVHQVGTMYLFNQHRYPHAIINTTDKDRLVMTGKFIKNQMPDSMVDCFRINKKHYLNHWIA